MKHSNSTIYRLNNILYIHRSKHRDSIGRSTNFDVSMAPSTCQNYKTGLPCLYLGSRSDAGRRPLQTWAADRRRKPTATGGPHALHWHTPPPPGGHTSYTVAHSTSTWGAHRLHTTPHWGAHRLHTGIHHQTPGCTQVTH